MFFANQSLFNPPHGIQVISQQSFAVTDNNSIAITPVKTDRCIIISGLSNGGTHSLGTGLIYPSTIVDGEFTEIQAQRSGSFQTTENKGTILELTGIKSIQYFNGGVSNNGSDPVTSNAVDNTAINAVDVDKSFVIPLGFTPINTSYGAHCSVYIDTSTNVKTSYSNVDDVSFGVVETF